MPRRSLIKMLFGAVVSILAFLNGTFSWYRAFDWLQRSAPSVATVLGDWKFECALVFVGISICGAGVKEIMQSKKERAVSTGNSPAVNPHTSAVAHGVSSVALGSIGSIEASRGSSVHIGNIHNTPAKEPPRVIFKAWEMNPTLPEGVVRVGQTGCYLATDGSAAYKVKIEPFPIGSLAYAQSAEIEWIGPNAREFACVWLMGYQPFEQTAKFLVLEAMARGNPRSGDILSPDYTTKIRAVYTDADGSCWYESVADLQYISSQGRLTFSGHVFRTLGPARPESPQVLVNRPPVLSPRRAPAIEPIQIDWKPEEFQFRHHFTLHGENLLFRVRVINNSDRYINRAEVKLTDLQPSTLPCVPVRLMLMNEPQSNGFFSLPAKGGSQFIDVIQQNNMDNAHFLLWHLAPGISQSIPAQAYTLTITAYTEAASTSRTFRLFREGSGWGIAAVN